MEIKAECNASPAGYARKAIREVVIPYRPEYTKLTGRVTAAILLQQIVFYWESCQKPFYKFRAPCTHPLYVEGDSWVECLGFSSAEFDTALKTIGSKVTTGTSKDELLAGKEVTNLVIYWTDSGRVTYYELNVPLFDKLTDPLYEDANSRKSNLLIQESAISKLQNPELPITEITKTPKEAATPSPATVETAHEEIYYRDKERVATSGRVRNPPWFTTCPICESEMTITTLDKPVECRCALGTITLLSKKSRAQVKMHPAVLILRKKVGNRKLNNEQVKLVESIVGIEPSDLDFWRQVIEAWLGHGWYEGNTKGMLDWYSREQLPTTRPKERTASTSLAANFKMVERPPRE